MASSLDKPSANGSATPDQLRKDLRLYEELAAADPNDREAGELALHIRRLLADATGEGGVREMKAPADPATGATVPLLAIRIEEREQSSDLEGKLDRKLERMCGKQLALTPQNVEQWLTQVWEWFDEGRADDTVLLQRSKKIDEWFSMIQSAKQQADRELSRLAVGHFPRAERAWESLFGGIRKLQEECEEVHVNQKGREARGAFSTRAQVLRPKPITGTTANVFDRRGDEVHPDDFEVAQSA